MDVCWLCLRFSSSVIQFQDQDAAFKTSIHKVSLVKKKGQLLTRVIVSENKEQRREEPKRVKL